MNRKDREITNFDDMLAILEKCDTISVGFQGRDYPYVVPVSFGFVPKDGAVTVYFHGARQGLKIDMLKENPNVCVEGHVFVRTEPTQHGITTRYESVIGYGTVERVEGEAAMVGLQSILAHYHYPDVSVESCRGLPMTAVYQINLTKLTGKRNINRI